MIDKKEELLLTLADMMIKHNLAIAELMHYKDPKLLDAAIRLELLKQQIKDERKSQ